MSLDPAINAALLNMCAQVQDSGNNGNTTTLALSAPPPATAAAAPSGARPAARPAADYEWLRSALASVESPEKRVKHLLLVTENRAAEGSADALDPEERLEGLEELSDMVEDVNWAAEFTLMQGPGRVLGVLRDECAAHPLTCAGKAGEGLPSLAVLTQLAMIVAHSAQLNEPVQAVYQAEHWEDVLLPAMLETLRAVEAVRTSSTGAVTGDSAKAAVSSMTKLVKLLAALLHACSCLCRESPPNTIQFIQQGGLAVLAEVLKLTLAVTSGATASDAFPGAAAPPSITTIQTEAFNETTGASQPAQPAEEEEDAVADDAPLIAAANKVTARVLFLSAYLASTGVSSEDLITLACQLAEANTDAAVQKAAARELLELVAKSPKAVKEAVHAHMPRRFYEWRRQLQHTAGGGEEGQEGKDERQMFVEALDASN